MAANCLHTPTPLIPYSGKFLRDKLLRISFVAIHESFFFAKFGNVASFGGAGVSNQQKFLRKLYFPPICESFLP